MKSMVIVSGILLLGTLAAVAQVEAQPEAALRAAMELETVKGDLKGALQRYAKLAEGKDRAVAAKALLRMAQCHEKLGDAEARKIYERLVRDFSDQKEMAAAARARLGNGAATASRAKGDRVVWSGKDVAHVEGSISPDGRYISYTDWWYTGNLMVHDLVAGTDRTLTGVANRNWSTEGNGEGACFSRDGRQIAYGWLAYSPRRAGIRVAEMEGTGPLKPRQLLADENIANMSAMDWSPDHRTIAVQFQRRDRSNHLGIVDVKDGALRTLRPLAWRGAQRVQFSPDGKYLAYDHPSSDLEQKRDLYVMTVDGTQTTHVAASPANDRLMGWSADGRHLLFTSDRAGSTGLWAVPVAGGKATGAPNLLKPDVGRVSSLGMTAAGTLHVYKDISTAAVHLAPIDLETGKLTGPSVVQGYRGRRPDWTRDGRFMAFRTECETGSCLAVRSTASGQVRELALPFTFFTEPSWSPDGKWVAVAARDYKGNSGVFRIDVESGETTKLAEGNHTARVLVSRDGRKLYAQAVEHDLATKATRTVYTPPVGARAGQYELSPDGRYFAVVQGQNPYRNASNSMAIQSAVMLVPVDGSAPRELFRASQQERFELFPSCLTWTADGRALVAMKSIGERKELWLLPLEGQPRKLEIDISEWHDEGIRLSPDGKQIAFLSGDRGEEVWALESFLPKVGGGGLR